MKIVGFLFLFLGISLGIYAFVMNTTMKVDYPMGNPMNFPTTIKNIGLMNDQRNYLLASGFLASFGVILFVVSYFIPKEKHSQIIDFAKNELSNKQSDFQNWKKNNPNKSIHDFYKENSK